ncbi:hypothetical protein [Alysiella crassa]|uniref:Uncharacterized protein n=1 Tax=Alysiella crassa TaxID=153491 RepID=A0A376BK46_9NEIS|nr:hypothetical protein [Alysiella crassa]UOP07649.1 hypothetical protein LVJ80_04580 [Alysiella crassa]SSY70122.1 Uncharacterised protein [Alysiella crassa]
MPEIIIQVSDEEMRNLLEQAQSVDMALEEYAYYAVCNHRLYLSLLRENKERYSRAADIRHEKTRQMKDQAIQDFKTEHTANQISRNEFAERYAKKYFVSQKTLRKWLQGE